MRRFFKYKNADGKLQGGIHNIDAGRAEANHNLAITAHRNGWTDIEVFDHRLPDHEIKRLVNEIQHHNNEPLLYEDHETKPPAEGAPAGPIIVIKDHAEGVAGAESFHPASAESRPGALGVPVAHISPPAPPQVQIIPGRVGIPQPQAVQAAIAPKPAVLGVQPK